MRRLPGGREVRLGGGGPGHDDRIRHRRRLLRQGRIHHRREGAQAPEAPAVLPTGIHGSVAGGTAVVVRDPVAGTGGGSFGVGRWHRRGAMPGVAAVGIAPGVHPAARVVRARRVVHPRPHRGEEESSREGEGGEPPKQGWA